MKIYYQKRPEGLFPIHESDKDSHYLLKNGSTFMKDFKVLRNPEYHKMVFKFLNTVFKFQDDFDQFELFRRRMKWYSQSFKQFMIDDTMITELDSWEFIKMNQLEFQALFPRLKTAAWDHYVHNTDDQEEIERRCQILLPYD